MFLRAGAGRGVRECTGLYVKQAAALLANAAARPCRPGGPAAAREGRVALLRT